jgi:prepilin-type N-terminal cleavage/methylation domain-containing protein
MNSASKTRLLKGFTLIEILFTLFLTSICLTAAYKGLVFMQNLLNLEAEKTKFISTYTRLSRAISTAYKEAENIEIDGTKCRMTFADSSFAELVISPDFLTFRQQLQNDTLFARCELTSAPTIVHNNQNNRMSLILRFQGNTYNIQLENSLANNEGPI